MSTIDKILMPNRAFQSGVTTTASGDRLDMTLYADKDSAVISGSVWAACWFSLYWRCI